MLQIYQGIHMVYVHVIQLFNSISSWFQQIDWSVITEWLPLPVVGMFAIVIALSAIGLIKKMSFLLG